MLIVISPAKTLDFEQKALTRHYSDNEFLPSAEKLVKEMKRFSSKKLKGLMGVSDNIAELNRIRFETWSRPFDLNNAKQALLAFKGDVYLGLDAESLSDEELLYSQQHLRILSGLYGLLKPLDLIQPYRLEMGTKLKTSKFASLYDFWGDKLTKKVNEDLLSQGDNVLINLASNEYFKALDKKKLKAEIISPVFKDFKDGKYKTISFFAKKARGLMSRFILENRLQRPDELKLFKEDGYYFSESESSINQFVFLRG